MSGRDSGELDWTEGGAPRSRRFDDIYYHPERGAEESEFNFLSGCGLPAAWRRQPGFVIAETGFGTGLNFLVTLAAWRRTRPAGHRLHYVSVERWPLARAELDRAHAAFPGLADEARALLSIYPEQPLAGYQRLHLDGEGLVLDLLVGEVAAMLGELEGRVDAWYLDGFAPDRNPAMWRDEVLGEIARLSDIGTRLGTFTAAGRVRRSLEHAGFAVHRVAGFGEKRERIVARFDGPTRASALPGWAQLFGTPGTPRIRGTGIAGRSVARALRRRGLPFVLETDPRMPRASEVPTALVMPRLTLDDSLPGRFFAQAFAYARREYRRLGCWRETGTLQLERRPEDPQRFRQLAARWPLARAVGATEAAGHAGLPVPCGGLFVPTAGFVDPRALLADASPGDGALEPEGPTIWAAGFGTCAGPPGAALPLEGYRGQVSLVRSAGPLVHQRAAVIGDRYLAPAVAGQHMIGSSFDRVAFAGAATAAAPAVAPDDHAENVRLIAEALALDPRLLEVSGGWAGIRAALPDRLPAAGPVPDAEAFVRHFEGLRTGQRVAAPADPGCPHLVLGGLGARGFTAAPLGAELLVSQWLGEPWPVPRKVGLALWPARFLVRALKRRER